MSKFSPFDTTLWYATATPAVETTQMQGVLKADVCIVGGGYTGLTTALELARDGISVVLLEREEIGFGGSGRNAGHCTPTFTHYSLPELRKMLGEPWAERLIARQTRANDRVSSMIERYQIQCEWQQNGYVMGAPYPAVMETIKEKVRTYNAVGAKTRALDKDEVEKITGSVPQPDLSLKLEPLTAAPFYMNFGPQLTLRYYRVSDWIKTRLAGAPLPPHA